MIVVAVLCAANVIQSGLFCWLFLSSQQERKTLLNAALAKSPSEFRAMEREQSPRPKPAPSWQEEAAAVSAAMGDSPYRMPEGMNG